MRRVLIFKVFFILRSHTAVGDAPAAVDTTPPLPSIRCLRAHVQTVGLQRMQIIKRFHPYSHGHAHSSTTTTSREWMSDVARARALANPYSSKHANNSLCMVTRADRQTRTHILAPNRRHDISIVHMSLSCHPPSFPPSYGEL